MNENLSLDLRKSIVTGHVADYATSCARLNRVSESELAEILLAIVAQLKK